MEVDIPFFEANNLNYSFFCWLSPDDRLYTFISTLRKT